MHATLAKLDEADKAIGVKLDTMLSEKVAGACLPSEIEVPSGDACKAISEEKLKELTSRIMRSDHIDSLVESKIHSAIQDALPGTMTTAFTALAAFMTERILTLEQRVTEVGIL